MIFSSVTFLFLFLPLVLALVSVSGRRYRNHVLLAASLFFYFWGEGVFTLLLIGSMLVNFFIAPALEQNSGKNRKFFLIIGVVLNLVPLFIFKYAGFFSEVFRPVLAGAGIVMPTAVSIYLPAGISFFTFQALSYLVDVYRGIVPAEQRVINCGLYISMFPQLIAGPIVRYHDISRQLAQRTMTRTGFARGAERFVFGLSKKVLLADPLGTRADQIFALQAADLSAPQAWLGALCFSLQIYYDFSGYSDMAIGLGRMFGFGFPENFNYPYVSRSIREFWRRWHISLSTWLRDYLYIPLGGNRRGTARTLINLLIVFLLCGLWHGANWTFIVWGLWHGMFLVVERLIPVRGPQTLRNIAGWLYATLVVVTGWVIFRSPTLAAAGDYFSVMAGMAGSGNAQFFPELMADKKMLTEIIVGCCLAAPLYPLFRQYSGRLTEYVQFRSGRTASGLALALARLGLFCGTAYYALITIAAQAYHPFLYFQF